MLFSTLRREENPRSDGWEGYPTPRGRIVNNVVDREISNLVVIGSDIRQFWVADVKAVFDEPNRPTVATNFVGSSIISTRSP